MPVRDFIASDRETYLSLSREMYDTNAVTHKVSESNFEATFDAALQKSPYARGFMLEHEGQAAGYGLISLTWSNEVGGLTIWLEELYIRPQFRSQKLGRTFIAFVEGEYPQAKRFRLEVSYENTRARDLYERLGYEVLPYTQMVKDT